MQDEYGSGYGIRSQLQGLQAELDTIQAAARAQASNEPVQWTARFVGERPSSMTGFSRRGIPVGKIEVEYNLDSPRTNGDPSVIYGFPIQGYTAWAYRSEGKGTSFAGTEGWIKAQDWVEQEWRKKIFEKHLADVIAERTKG